MSKEKQYVLALHEINKVIVGSLSKIAIELTALMEDYEEHEVFPIDKYETYATFIDIEDEEKDLYVWDYIEPVYTYKPKK